MVNSTAASRRPRTRSRALRRTVIALVSLLVLLLVVDRGGDLVAENLAASKLQSSQHLTSKPDVAISGFPFLTQFASGHYNEVTVTSNNVPIGSGGVRLTLSSVRVVLHDMTVTNNFSNVHVARATAMGTVGYPELSKTLGVDLSYAGAGKVRASKQITLGGVTITPTITATPGVVNNSLSFAAAQANGLGPLANQLSRVAGEIFGNDIPLRGIPFGVRVDKLSTTGQGLQIELSGSDITYNR